MHLQEGNIITPMLNCFDTEFKGLCVASLQMSSLLSIPGNLTHLNNSQIGCLIFMNNTLIAERTSIFLIQGKLNAVINLTMQSDGPCCTNITWIPPFSLPGVPILGYYVNIIRSGQIIDFNETSKSEWKYCTKEFGDYNVSVEPINSSGGGDVLEVFFPKKYDICEMKLLNQTIKTFHQWILKVEIIVKTSVILIVDDIQQVIVDFVDTELNISADDVLIANESLIATFMTDDPRLKDSRQSFTSQILMNCGLIVSSSVALSIGFFDVINLTVLSNSVSDLAFTCHFVSGSLSLGCNIRLIQSGLLIEQFNISRENNKTLMASGGLNNSSVSPGHYTINVYDINLDNDVSLNAAYSTTMEIIETISNVSITTDSTLNTKPTDTGVILGVSFGIIIILIIAATLTLMVIIIILLRKKHQISLADSPPKNLYMGIDLPNDENIPNTKKCSITIENDMIDKFKSTDLLIYNDSLRLLDCIGEGEFGLVYKAHLFNEEGIPSYVAVKTLKGVFNQNEVNELLTESLHMKHFSHLNVMGLIGVCIDSGSAPFIILPFMAGGSLLSYLKRNRDHILLTEDSTNLEQTESHLLSMCLQIARGMTYIASQNMIHRDLAARNCMIDHQGIIKVSDFGLSKNLYEKAYFRQESFEGIKLPIKWMAVESITDKIFTEKTDVWSFGVTCWEIFNGGIEPFGGINFMSISNLLEQGQRLNKPTNCACSLNTYENLMVPCWHTFPNERPTFAEIVDAIENTLTSLADYVDCNQFVLEIQNDIKEEEC
jgi:hypothetical protein